MADNIQLDAGTGGDTVAADDIGGIKYQRVKLTHGADGSATDVSSASPLPMWHFLLEVQRGNITGMAVEHKFGANSDIDSAFEAVWTTGGSYTGHDATGAEVVEVFSDDANDASAGTGARTVQVFGLDGAYAEQNETVTLNGVTAVDTANSYIRLNRMVVRTAGSGGENAGTIQARQSVTTANVFAEIAPTCNQTLVACYTVPAGKTGYILQWFASATAAVSATSDVRIWVRPDGEVFQMKEEIGITDDGASHVERVYLTPKGPYAAKSDIEIRANSSAVNLGISAGFDLLLIDD